MKHEIEIEIDEATGEITAHVQGVKGKGCTAILDALAREVGGERGEVRYTAAYYAAEATAKTGQRGGAR